MAFIDDLRFDQSFSFIYSARPGTPAAALPDDVSQEQKLHRLAILQRRITEFSNAYNAAMVGTTQRVLVTGHARKDTSELSARSAHNRVVNFAGPRNLIGDFTDVRISAALPNSLRGEWLGAVLEVSA